MALLPNSIEVVSLMTNGEAIVVWWETERFFTFITTLLGAIAGGILTFIGGFYGSIFLQSKLARKRAQTLTTALHRWIRNELADETEVLEYYDELARRATDLSNVFSRLIKSKVSNIQNNKIRTSESEYDVSSRRDLVRFGDAYQGIGLTTIHHPGWVSLYSAVIEEAGEDVFLLVQKVEAAASSINESKANMEQFGTQLLVELAKAIDTSENIREVVINDYEKGGNLYRVVNSFRGYTEMHKNSFKRFYNVLKELESISNK
jgi:hypothetical protein